MSILKKIDLNNTPKHIAIIMDGNGRWAQQQGHSRLFGHNFGVESVREVLKAAQKTNVEYLTLYAFSTENWNRPQEEVDGLMDLLVRTIGNEVEELHKSNVKISTIGNILGLPESCGKELHEAHEKTKKNTGVNLILALNYSSRWELTNAAKNIAIKVESGKINADEIDEHTIISELNTSNIPDPELLIRTSGEYRVSNFLLWQIAYAEFYFTDVLWPDFKASDLYKAILDYQSRERRFGMVSEQIEKDS
ncbi:MAG: isoprenyl transferase [Crocinitomicaceae bacterium]|nr:isoprenyl transferase [Crocinitomicaceae bacterium]